MLLRTAGGLLALLLVACTGSDPAADGMVLRRGNSAEPATLDPHRAKGIPANNILRDLYEGLVGEAPDGSLTPGAAARWDISADGLTYTFHIRDNARWSNGTPLTAQDFVYSLRRIVTPDTGSSFADILTPIQNAAAIIAGEAPPESLGVAALDEKTLRITLAAPTPYFLALLTDASAYPVYRPAIEQYGDAFVRPGRLVSNGAYQLADWRPQAHLTLTRNPHYWNNAATKIDTVRYFPLPDQAAELARYRAGELDITYTVPLEQLPWIREYFAEELKIAPWLGVFYLGLNTSRPPLDDARLRQALAMAVDRQVLTAAITAGGEQPAYGWVPPVNNYTSQQAAWAALPRAEQLALAKRLYREAGYDPAHPLQLELLYNTHRDYKRIAEAVASMWRDALGVQITLVNQEWKVYLQTRADLAQTQVFRAGWIGDYNDANAFAEILACTHGLNDTGYCNPEYDALLTRAASEQDPSTRRAVLEKAERLLLRDMPVIPLYFYATRRLVKPAIGGYQANIMDHHYSKNLYFQPAPAQ